MNAETLFGARLLEFNLLPSRTLHPSRHAEYGAPVQAVPADYASAWHRHWSREILQRLGLLDRPVQDASLPELALALLPPENLARVARFAGAALCAPRLRRAIAGSEVRQLTSALGADVLDFARHSAESIHPGIGNLNLSEEEVMAGAVDRLGCAAVMAAVQAAGPELALRTELKLPAEPLVESPCDTSSALALGLSLLRITDPTWHSSSPAMR